MPEQEDIYGLESPGGFVFGVTGWHWGEPRPTSITFFLDNTAKVSDQHGRPIKGVEVNGKQVRFAAVGPPARYPEVSRPTEEAKGLATHAQVIAALAAERIDWRGLTCAGFPQLPYEELSKLPDDVVPPLATTAEEHNSFIGELRKIRDPELRKAALRHRREQFEVREKEARVAEEE